ncbi:glycosyltransferase family 2 protein [bacterium]|nr:glycosyltransferase family 2 protein [bacterium]
MPSISGFTIVRNARRLHYPFEQSVLSALPLCDEFIIGCGDSDDGTRELCATLAEAHPKIRVFDSVWTRASQSGGFQLKHQSDLALHRCQGDWCLYIQADEALHEGDFPSIRAALESAHPRAEVDGLVFDYRHFYGSYGYEIRGRNWYRKEVRLFKNRRGIEAFRDAQGFRRNGERLRAVKSGARVFHYGYVRTPESLGTKASEMAQWWGVNHEAKPETLHRHVGLRAFRETHPAVMQELTQLPNPFDPKACTRKWDRGEIKNALTLAWESVFPFRLGEFRNYDLV